MNKKHFLLSFVVAAMAILAAGCQKEEGTVTLGAEIHKSSNGKVYINDHTPCWHNGDQVYINNAAYSIMAATGASAQIEEVTRHDTYRAIFPAGIVASGSNISNSASVPVILPAVQQYQMVGDHQRVDVPMGAYLTSGSTLHFYNLCSIVRVTVSNYLNQDLSLSKIVLQAEQARLSGSGSAIVNGSASNAITMASTASHQVTLNFTEDYPATVDALGTATFDIVVPAFTTDNVTIRIVTTNRESFAFTKNNVGLLHNTITTVNVNVIELIAPTYANLVDGPTFNSSIPSSATQVVFEYGTTSPAIGDNILSAILSTSDSPEPIFGYLDGTVWRVSTRADTIYANTDCSYMFYRYNDGEDGIGDEFPPHLSVIDFGNGFNTSNVTNMNCMFQGCSFLECLDLSCFNTSNVTNMSKMFYMKRDHYNYPSQLISINLSNFNTSNVIDMSMMFTNCNNLTNLDLSNFNTSNVIDMSMMFTNCNNLTNLDLSNFNTSNVTNMSSMFGGCSGLISLDVSNFNTSNVTNMQAMFSGCDRLTSLDLSSFNTPNVTDMMGMFMGCRRLTSLNLSYLDMSHLEHADIDYGWIIGKDYMCSDLSTITGHCTITCPLVIQIELENGTDLPTSGVTFTWVRPSSSK